MKNHTTFLKRAEYFLARKNAPDEYCGRIPLGDDTGATAVMLWPIRFRCIAIVHTSTADYAHTELRIAQDFQIVTLR